jgi:hypothetical protein
MTSSTLIHETFRTGYATMTMAELEQTSSPVFSFNPFDHLDDFINDAELNFKLEELMDLPLSSQFDIYRSNPLSYDEVFDLPDTVDPFIYQQLYSDPTPSPSLFPPSNLSYILPSNHHQGSSGLTHIRQESFVELRGKEEESPYRNIPTVVQTTFLSEDEGEEEEDEEGASIAAESGYGQLNPPKHKSDKIPLTIYTSTKTPAAAPRRVRRRKDQLWYFLLETLGNPKYNPHFIQWENKDLGIFRFIQSKKVAQLWGAKKNRSNMSYEYFARAMRHYYSRGIMHRVAGRRLVYQFGPKAENWKNYAQLVTISASSTSSSSSSISSSHSNSSSISNTTANRS